MGAVFPKGIKSFPTHRNLLDDVKAEHVNAIQDEVVALQSIMGPLINEVEEIATDVDELEEENARDDVRDSVIKQKFRNLKERLEYITEGRHLYACELVKREQTISNWSKKNLDGNIPQIVKFPKPVALNDPKGLYNGTGITLRKGGFWIINGHVRYLTKGGADAKGAYQASLSRNGEVWAWGTDRDYIDTNDGGENNVFLNPLLVGFFPRGTRIALRTSQSSNRPQDVSFAWFGAIRLRGF